MNIINQKMDEYKTLRCHCDNINYYLSVDAEPEYISESEILLWKFSSNNRRARLDDINQSLFVFNVKFLHNLFDAVEVMNEACGYDSDKRTKSDRAAIARILDRNVLNFARWIIRQNELHGEEAK